MIYVDPMRSISAAPARTVGALGLAIALSASTLLAGCKLLTRRSDDVFEPNDTPSAAVPLKPGQALEGRANQGNADFFVVDAPEGRSIEFSIENRGLEDCAAFTVTGPAGEVLYRDAGQLCGRSSANPPETTPGVELVGGGSQGYRLRLPSGPGGRYYLEIVELGRADNEASFSWDYRVSVKFE